MKPTTLLSLCIFWSKTKGGTIHQYLPNLSWKHVGYDRKLKSNHYQLMLNGSTAIAGMAVYFGEELPDITVALWSDRGFTPFVYS